MRKAVKGKVVLTAPGLPRRRPSREAATLARLDRRPWARVTPAYRALDFTFAIRFADADLADYVETLFAPFATDAPAAHLYSFVDDGPRYKSRYALYFDGQHILRTHVEPLALAYLSWHLNTAVVAESDRYLLVHAAAASYHGSVILLPASMESGKTTLVAGLVQRGLGYLTDEAAAIDPASLAVSPYPKPLSVEPGSFAALADLRPQLPPRLSLFTRDQWWLAPESIHAGAIAGPGRARLVVSPRYEAGADTTLSRISRAEAVLLLAENAFNFPAHGARGLETLAAVVRDCDCYRLTVGTLAAACDAVIGAADRLGAGVR